MTAGSDVSRDTGEAGTTLLELLVALALLALLCTYALGALRHLKAFDRVVDGIGEANSVDAVASHIRQAIAGARVVFLAGKADEEARLAFLGEESRISFVTGADSRLEYGGLYLVHVGLTADEDESHQLIETRRVFRPAMAIKPGEAEPIVLADHIGSLAFRYFGSAEEGASPEWHATWTFAKTLPKAVEIMVTFDDDRRKWPPTIVTIPAAR